MSSIHTQPCLWTSIAIICLLEILPGYHRRSEDPVLARLDLSEPYSLPTFRVALPTKFLCAALPTEPSGPSGAGLVIAFKLLALKVKRPLPHTTWTEKTAAPLKQLRCKRGKLRAFEGEVLKECALAWLVANDTECQQDHGDGRNALQEEEPLPVGESGPAAPIEPRIQPGDGATDDHGDRGGGCKEGEHQRSPTGWNPIRQVETTPGSRPASNTQQEM